MSVNTVNTVNTGFTVSSDKTEKLNALGQMAAQTVYARHRMFKLIAKAAGAVVTGHTYAANAYRFVDKEGIIKSACDTARTNITDALDAREKALQSLRVRAEQGEMMNITIESETAIIDMLMALGMPAAEAHAALRDIGIDITGSTDSTITE